MSTRALDILRTVGLLDNKDSVTDLSRFDGQSLQKILEYYASKRAEHLEQEVAEVKSTEGDLSALVSSVSGRNVPASLLPSAFMFTRIYANDPLYHIAKPVDEMTRVHKQAMRMKDPPLDHRNIGEILAYFSSMAPLIRQGIHVVLPLDILHTPPEHRPLNFSEDAFRSQVPAHLHDWVHDSAIISKMQPGPNGSLVLVKKPSADPTRGIAVQFRNDQVCGHHMYLLHDMKVVGKNADGTVTVEWGLDWSNKPSREYYDHWVYQSINREIIERLTSISRESSLAGVLGACYMTESDFEAKLCGLASTSTGGRHARIDAVNFLRANAPYLKISSAEAVARIRADDPKLFERFQLSLLAVSAELEGMDAGFADRAKQLFEKDIQPQVEEINIALTKAATALAKGGVLAAGTLALAILTGGVLPVVSILGIGIAMSIGEALPEIAEYRKKRRGPAFIWKQITE